jgi:Fe-S cluster assembly protein SufD
MNAAPVSGFAHWLSAPPAAGAGRSDWLETLRAKARALVLDQGIPTTKTEEWRYTSLARLLDQGFTPVAEADPAWPPEAIAGFLIPGLDTHRVVLVNGRFAPNLSSLHDLPPGVRIAGLDQVLRSDPDLVRVHLNTVVGESPPLFAALNTAGLSDGLVILVDQGVRLERPIELIHLSASVDGPRVAQPRYLLALEGEAQANLIERTLGTGDLVHCTNSVLELSLGPKAVLKHQHIQAEGAKAYHSSGLYLSLGTGSRYQGVNIGLSAAWSRTDLKVRFAGEGAECDLQGLYLAGDRQLVDYHLDVDHRLPHCTSRENYKGILYGKGRAVFDGRVLVAKDAQRTDAAMTNRNLILCEGAEVDTKPQLEINADDVKCSHGTTVGQIEPEQLFYLRSRGISLPVARRILCLGFAGEILDALSPEALRDQVAEEVGRLLEQAPLD